MIVAQHVDESAVEVNVDDVPAVGVADEGATNVNVDVVLTVVDEPFIPSPPPTTQPPPPSQDVPSTLQVQPTPPPSPIDQPLSPPPTTQPPPPLQDVPSTSQVQPTPPPSPIDQPLSPPPTTQPPPPLQDVPSTSQVQPTPPPSPIDQPLSPQQQPQPSQDSEISMNFLYNLLDTCITLTRRVENLEQDKIAQALEITKLKQRVKKLERRNKLKVSKLRRLKKVGTSQRVDTSDDTVMDYVSKQGRIIADMDADVDITLKDVADIAKEVIVDAEIEENPVELQEVVEVVTTAKLITKVVIATSATITDAALTLTTAPSAQALKRKPQTKAQARKNMMIYLRNMAGFKMDYFKGMKYDDIHPIFKKYFKSNKLDEEVAELKRHLQIVPNDEDDVYTKATPLARKVSDPKNYSDDFLLTTLTYMFEKPGVQAQVWKNQRTVHGLAKVKNWKLLESYGVHIITFTSTQMILLIDIRYPLTRFTLDQKLNNVRRKVEEESEVSLELLRFPKNYSDDFLLTTLTYMFEKPGVQAQVWKNQRTVHGLAKVFANIRRVGKGFLGVDTPSFEGMIVAQQVDESAAEVNVDDVPAVGVADEGATNVNVDVVLTVIDEPSIPSPPPTTQPPPPSQDVPSTSQVQPTPSPSPIDQPLSPPPTTQPPPPLQDVPSTSQVQPTPPPSPIDQPPSPQQQLQPSQDAEISMNFLHNLLDTCTTLTRRVENLEQDKIAQALEITKLKQRVKKLERRNKLKVSKFRRLKKVGTSQRVDTSDDTVMDYVSKQGRIIADMDADVDITLKDVADIAKEVIVDAEIEESVDVQGRQAESQAQIYQINLEHADKVLSMQDDKVDPVELQEVVEVVTTAKLITKVVIATSATITDAALTLTTAPSAVRRRNGVVIRDLEETATQSTIIHTEAKSKYKGKGILVEEPKPLKKQAQIEQDEAFRKEKKDNAVMRYQALKRKPQTKAQARKNMMIYLRNMAGFKMDYFKGMKYDYIRPIFKKYFKSNVAFLEKTKEQMKEEESIALKRINDFLLTNLTYMFEKPGVQAQVWKNQRTVHGLAKVKSWKLLESYGVHIITFTSTQMILLIDIRYPLTRFTLDQKLNNVRRKVEEESEVSLELLRFVRQQQQEGFKPE
nr:hypothetical protein [Tanacetum cinerariifolium]